MTYDLRFALAVICALGGCQPASADPKPTGADAPSVRFERDMMTRFHMHASFDTVRGIERLLIRGKIDDARYFAQSLATQPEIPGLAPWAKQVALVRERAAAVGSAPGLDEACRREARLAEACAQCHAAASAQPDFGPPPRLQPDQGSVISRMVRHQWAADRIWEGMIGDSDDAWTAGLDVLAAAPLPFAKTDGDRANLARRLQELADQARHPANNDLAVTAPGSTARSW